MGDYVQPVFHLLTGASGLLFLFVALRTRALLVSMTERLLLIGLIFIPLGFQLMAQAGGAGTFNRASPMILASGAAFGVAMLAISVGIFAVASRLKSQDGA